MHVLISGSTGLIGNAVFRRLNGEGHFVRRLVRPGTRIAAPGGAPLGSLAVWAPGEDRLPRHVLEGTDIVIHLAGEPILGRWSEAKKQRIHDSRVESTRLLAESMAEMTRPPQLFICASAVGYYGDRGEEVLTEQSAPGEGFLARTAEQWEKATQPASFADIRVVNLRLGVVLSPAGGALAMMLPIFRLGLGGPLGAGSQYMSWVTLEDVVRAVRWLIKARQVRGPVNMTAPSPVTNRTFARGLGSALRRPAVLPAPSFALRLALGKDAADEMLLASVRAVPDVLGREGFVFRHPDLDTAFGEMLE